MSKRGKHCDGGGGGQMGTRVMAVLIRMQIYLQQMTGRFLAGARGQGMVEYALILAFVAILVIVALKLLQPRVSQTLNTVANSL